MLYRDASALLKVKGRQELCLGMSDPWSIWSRKYMSEKGVVVPADVRNNEYRNMPGPLFSDSPQPPENPGLRILGQSDTAYSVDRSWELIA